MDGSLDATTDNAHRTPHRPRFPSYADSRTDGEEAAVTETALAEVMAELASLEDPGARAVNEKHGDDHGVNLSKLRAVAKRLKTQQELSRDLWKTVRDWARSVGWWGACLRLAAPVQTAPHPLRATR